jgi:SAM-dependent methyltransferase
MTPGPRGQHDPFGMMAEWSKTTDWAGYYAWSAGREPRPLLLAACQEQGPGNGRMAIDLGCGDGTDALELLARGWSVTAVDATEAGLKLLSARIPAAAGIGSASSARRSPRLTFRARI